MKACILLVAVTGFAFAQIPEALLAGKLALDLQPLASVSTNYDSAPAITPAIPEGKTAWQRWMREQNPEHNRILSTFIRDVDDWYGRPVVSWNLAFVLTGILAGNDLSLEKLRPLTTSLLEAFDAGFDCNQPLGCQLDQFDKFQSAVLAMNRALKAVGINEGRREIVLEELYNTASSINRDVQLLPIPPATRPSAPPIY